jgi:hypothetical protein
MAPASQSSNGSNSASGNLSVAVGAGLGVPLSVAAVGFLGFLFFRQRGKGRDPGMQGGQAMDEEQERRRAWEKKQMNLHTWPRDSVHQLPGNGRSHAHEMLSEWT